MPTEHAGKPPVLYSIGDVARLTGISESTIRVWERRYGRPAPIKTTTGHRRYSGAEVRWLRRVAEALAHGHRPKYVVAVSEADLEELLSSGLRTEPALPGDRLEPLIRTLRHAELVRALSRSFRELGAIRFAHEYMEPLLSSLGRAWADGELDVYHEHFASSVIEDVLRSLRLASRKKASGPVVVLATLAGERHDLGLQLAALIAVGTGCRCRLLGIDTPIDEIVAAARETRARGVALSVSLATGGVTTDRQLAQLRAKLPHEVRLAVGGRGARGVRRGQRGIDYLDRFEPFCEWLYSLSQRSLKPRRHQPR